MSVLRPVSARKHSISFSKPSRTKQSFRNECDINVIMSRFEKTGLLSHVKEYGGQYGDFTGLPDYQESMNRVASANHMFSTLPARVRDMFANDPGQFIAFVENPDNEGLARELGLFKPKEEPKAPARLSNPDSDPKDQTKAAKAADESKGG